jgi:biopolymer transport protein ExbD/biopolymer transport protein TolR
MFKASNPVGMEDANKPDAIIVSVGRDGKIFLGNEIVTADLLTEKIRGQLTNRGNKTVYVRADARARYRFLVESVDHIRSAGADQLGLLTERKTNLARQ